MSAAMGLGFAGLRACVVEKNPVEGYGPLIPDPNGILDLPAGFSYKSFSHAGERMSDGFFVPGLHDGMAAFAGLDGRTLLLRNHEVNVESDFGLGAFGPDMELLGSIDPSHLYDSGANDRPCLGGVSTIVYDTRTQSMESHHLSLAGTLRNCAGGPTPWDSWITCEETVITAGEVCAQDHGYCFEVPASATARLFTPVPLKAMGRFNHEAIAVDPATGIVYLTEDDNESLIYRFIPSVPGKLAEGGTLQAMVVVDAPSLDTRNWTEQSVLAGEPLHVSWIDMEEVDSPEDDLRHRGHAAGAARFARGEGMWYGHNQIFFACTSGGPSKSGQIWKYVPENEQLTLFVEGADEGLIRNADNLTISPSGHVIVCEDSPRENDLVGITPEGRIYRLARNVLSDSELAGAVFSPDGSTLFLNIQYDGITVAITGPWA